MEKIVIEDNKDLAWGKEDCQVNLVPPYVSRTAIGEMVRQSSFTATIVATRLMAGPSPVHVRGRTHILLIASFILDEVNEPSVLE